MRFRIKTLVIPLALVAAGSGIVDGKHSRLMAQNQDPAQTAKNEPCETIRHFLMGEDGTGKNGGLRYEQAQTEAKIAQLQKDLDAAHQQTISLTVIDQHINDDLRTLHGPWAVSPPDKETVALARRDLDFWTAQKDQRKGGLGLQDTGLQWMRSRDQYPPSLQRDLDLERKRSAELSLAISKEDGEALKLNCKAYWASHPVGSASAAAPSASGTDPGGGTVRVKVITTVSCSASDAGGDGLGRVTVEFHKLKPDGTLDPSSAPLRVTTGRDGTTAASGPVRIPPDSYTVKAIGPGFGNLAWVNLHIASDPGGGDRYNIDAKTDGVSVTFMPISALKGAEEYQLAVRMTSQQACPQ
jgi:hypothetical protein